MMSRCNLTETPRTGRECNAECKIQIVTSLLSVILPECTRHCASHFYDRLLIEKPDIVWLFISFVFKSHLGEFCADPRCAKTMSYVAFALKKINKAFTST